MASSIPNIISNHANIQSAKTILSAAASVAASAMVIRTITRDLIPYELQQYIHLSIQSFLKSYSSQITLIIEESSGLSTNQIYKAAEIYIGTKISPNTNNFMVTMPKMESKISTSMAKNQGITDNFNGVIFKWRQITRKIESTRSNFSFPGQHVQQSEVKYFELRFHKKHKKTVFESYFPYILSESKKLQDEKKTLKIYTLNSDQVRRYSGDFSWSSIKLDHPATFDTLAMDPTVKKMIMDDLDMFVRRRDFYRKVGKAWKRGYLLYGPPGTGKSSLIAAMANYLNFDVYDLELTCINTNSDLRKLLINTGNRSILVEDIDCSLEIDDRKAEERTLKMLRSSQSQIQTVNIVRKDKTNQVTLSVLLNFIDGLWSSCGDERIIVFTTNHKDRLDPALRPGRMDLHIFMSYCTPSAFKTLAANYHGISSTDHLLFTEISTLLDETTLMVTPAEVGEQLLRSENVEIALEGLIVFLQQKKRESDEKKAKSLLKQEEGGEVQEEEEDQQQQQQQQNDA